VVCLQCVRGYT